MFRTVPLSIIISFSLYTQQWYMSYSLWAGSGRNCSSVLILLASCQQTCMTYTIAVCTVKISWWWTEELPETCSFFISVINQLDAQNFCFTIKLFHASTWFEHQVLITRRSKLRYTASGIITPIGGRLVHRLRERERETATYRCDDTHLVQRLREDCSPLSPCARDCHL